MHDSIDTTHPDVVRYFARRATDPTLTDPVTVEWREKLGIPRLVDTESAMDEMTWVTREARELIEESPSPWAPDQERDAWELRRDLHRIRKQALLAYIEKVR